MIEISCHLWCHLVCIFPRPEIHAYNPPQKTVQHSARQACVHAKRNHIHFHCHGTHARTTAAQLHTANANGGPQPCRQQTCPGGTTVFFCFGKCKEGVTAWGWGTQLSFRNLTRFEPCISTIFSTKKSGAGLSTRGVYLENVVKVFRSIPRMGTFRSLGCRKDFPCSENALSVPHLRIG